MSGRRWEDIVGQMKAAIRDGDLRRGERLPSETEFAAQWNISRMTAHRVMRELHDAGLVERRPGAGTVVALQRRLQTVAVVLHDTRLNPQASFLQGIAEALAGKADILLCDNGGQPEREAAFLEDLLERADGAIVFPTAAPENTDRLEAFRRALPLVCIDRVPEGLAVDAVVADEFESSLEGLRLLTGRGHRRIAHLTSGAFNLSSVRGRLDAYRAALAEIDVVDDGLICIVDDGGVAFREFAERVFAALQALMRRRWPPTALFCLHDDMMSAALSGCERVGLSIPEDLEILSVNDTPALPIFGIDMVHRIVPPTLELGNAAAQRLLELAQQSDSIPKVLKLRSAIIPATPYLRRDP